MYVKEVPFSELPRGIKLQTSEIMYLISYKVLNCLTIWVILNQKREREKDQGEQPGNTSNNVKNGFLFCEVLLLTCQTLPDLGFPRVEPSHHHQGSYPQISRIKTLWAI